jgi:hypothetical protein
MEDTILLYKDKEGNYEEYSPNDNCVLDKVWGDKEIINIQNDLIEKYKDNKELLLNVNYIYMRGAKDFEDGGIIYFYKTNNKIKGSVIYIDSKSHQLHDKNIKGSASTMLANNVLFKNIEKYLFYFDFSYKNKQTYNNIKQFFIYEIHEWDFTSKLYESNINLYDIGWNVSSKGMGDIQQKEIHLYDKYKSPEILHYNQFKRNIKYKRKLNTQTTYNPYKERKGHILYNHTTDNTDNPEIIIEINTFNLETFTNIVKFAGYEKSNNDIKKKIFAQNRYKLEVINKKMYIDIRYIFHIFNKQILEESITENNYEKGYNDGYEECKNEYNE